MGTARFVTAAKPSPWGKVALRAERGYPGHSFCPAAVISVRYPLSPSVRTGYFPPWGKHRCGSGASAPIDFRMYCVPGSFASLWMTHLEAGGRGDPPGPQLNTPSVPGEQPLSGNFSVRRPGRDGPSTGCRPAWKKSFQLLLATGEEGRGELITKKKKYQK